MTASNERLEERIEAVRAALLDLARTVDENLRTVHLLLTTEQEIAQGLEFHPVEELAQAVMDRSMTLLGLQAPMAHDLRWAMAVIRIGKDYERIQHLAGALYKRAARLGDTILAEILHVMTEVTSELLATHRLILRLLGGEAKLGELMPRLRLHHATVEARLVDVESLAVNALVEGQEDAANLRELVLATRHVKRISDELALIPQELVRAHVA